ncbi:MAG: hypothetical protein IT190_07515 [Microbacteriaceae bacterium]|nr:hypothetical protein [Microbacteriaceae bacterium]
MTAIIAKAEAAEDRYGPFASSHEALGVACEEWDELRAAIHSNDMDAIGSEAIDLAAVLYRLALACVAGGDFSRRSTK